MKSTLSRSFVNYSITVINAHPQGSEEHQLLEELLGSVERILDRMSLVLGTAVNGEIVRVEGTVSGRMPPGEWSEEEIAEVLAEAWEALDEEGRCTCHMHTKLWAVRDAYDRNELTMQEAFVDILIIHEWKERMKEFREEEEELPEEFQELAAQISAALQGVNLN